MRLDEKGLRGGDQTDIAEGSGGKVRQGKVRYQDKMEGVCSARLTGFRYG